MSETTTPDREELVRELRRELATGWPPPVVLDGGPDTPEAIARRREQAARA